MELLPEHPLADRGYPSIGCWPCTRPVADGADPRSGRWAGSDKSECGLHGGVADVPVVVSGGAS
jgi:phosphoadenosine phosphosulfate reductase